MPIIRGTTNMSAIYKGGTPITKVYIGDRVLFQIGGDYYELIEDITISVATTSVTFSGFTATKEDSLVLVSDIVNPSLTNNVNYYLYANNNTTITNYYKQTLYAQSTTVASFRGNDAQFSASLIDNNSLSIANIKLTNDGYFTYQSDFTLDYGLSSIYLQDAYGSSTFTTTSITQLDIVSSVANAIGIGSRFQLYRLIGGN